jgi:hypothetical protein
LLHIPLVQDPPTSLDASLPAPAEEATQCGPQARGQEVEGHGDHISRGKPS